MKLAFYGDDFTGSTDALGMLARAGYSARLYLKTPTADELADAATLDAVGIAGVTRSLPPDQIDAELEVALPLLAALQPTHLHYKVCSTFDSSPAIGSIGRAIESGLRVLKSRWVPLLVGIPEYGRFCAFGNLYARVGIGSDSVIYRLDHHPSMSRHPVTPAEDADLRRHLAKQTSLRCGLLDCLDLEMPIKFLLQKLESSVANGNRIVLMDFLQSHQAGALRSVLEHAATSQQPLFSVGSSAIESVLFPAESRIDGPAPLEPTDSLLVLSGSRSPVTRAQIDAAVAAGFVHYALNPACLDNQPEAEKAIAAAADFAVRSMKVGQTPIIHSDALSPAAVIAQGSEDRIGKALGNVAMRVAQSAGLQRLVIAGGDSSGHACRGMGINSLQVKSTFWHGAPLCSAHSSNPALCGMELILKGGQVGTPDFFLLSAGSNFNHPQIKVP